MNDEAAAPIVDIGNTPELDLIRAVANGDEAALREIYERHARWLAIRLRRILSVEATEDVMQETFLAVWRGAGRYGESGELGAWIWGIARRQAALWLRRHGRIDASLDEHAATARSAGADPSHEAIARVELHQAFASVGAPGSPAHDLARRVFIEDQPLGDIATELNVPTGTVKSRIFKLRRTMKQALGREIEP